MPRVKPQPQNVYPRLSGRFGGATFVYLPSVALLRSRQFQGSIGSGTPVLQQPAYLSVGARTARIDNLTYIAMGATSRDLAFPNGMTILAVGSYSTASGICSLTARGSGGSEGGWMVSLRNQFAGTPAGIYASHNISGAGGDTSFESCWVNGAKDAGNGNGNGGNIFGTAVNTRYAVCLATTAATSASTSDDIYIGHNLSYDQSTNIEFVVIWPRRLTEQEMALVSVDPYQVFYRQDDTVAATVGAAAYELSVDPATYTLTAAAETLTATRALSIDPASYSLTAAAETLSVGRAVNFAPASYALTAAAETLTATRSLSIDPASYALSAAAETLSVGRALSVAPASYVLTASAETLTVARALSIDPAAYSLTAADVEFERTVVNPVLSIDPVSYVLSLADVTFERSSEDSGPVTYAPAPKKKRKKGPIYFRHIEPEDLARFEQVAQEIVQEPEQPKPQAKVRAVSLLKEYGIYQDAYIAALLDLERELRKQQAEDDEIMSIIAAAL